MATQKPSPEQHTSIKERASFYLKNIAAAFGVDDATVRDIVSGKKFSLGRRKKQVEAAQDADSGRFGKTIEIP